MLMSLTGKNVSRIALLAGLVAATASMSAPEKARAATEVCGQDWKPVCGSVNNWQRTYSNACWARANKAKILYDGACKWK
jgi:hypothetical protein